ncbi:MAG: lysine--tRNA ligase [Proteobacteria bacterium]|nr:lysine--tRNA ligase [Pseudomonadota bacterium]
MANEAEILAARRKRAERLRDEAGAELFPARVPRPLDSLREVSERWAESDAEALEEARAEARVAGRIAAVRSFGKAAFVTLQADGARLQVWVKRDRLGSEVYRAFRLYEAGDFIWARGGLLRTRSGELTVEAEEIGFLAKSYRPLPEKFHGLVDVETRYRQRYLDLLVNPEARDWAVKRSRMVSALRALLDERGFLEVETPVLQPLYGGAHATPFVTRHKTYDQQLYLRISFELYLKRLIIGGLDRVYEIGRDFRNEGVSRKHNPEFSMLEVYQAYADYTDMMELTENLVAGAAERVGGGTRVERDGRGIDLAPPWPRRPMAELIRERTGVDIEQVTELEPLRDEVRRAGVAGVDPAASPTWAALVDAIFSQAVEPELIDPVFVLDYPAALSPLAKRDESRPHLVERFEAFIGGMEIANAFSELNDPDDQRARFEEQAAAARSGDAEAHPVDEDFLRALEHGMPPTGGMGMGVGRLAMILTGAAHLREVKLFPHLRPRDA